eukprot:TRINITY_DN39603_c0_g1_i1.p1 TRINITY_DN39603_c0_g1~~TRINITY_DN39603_c0_g1_i1.p1  ORF type:complete len:255 (+),score=88.21 TRINITY_DN39603_c0_g1_i1:60-767(+)
MSGHGHGHSHGGGGCAHEHHAHGGHGGCDHGHGDDDKDTVDALAGQQLNSLIDMPRVRSDNLDDPAKVHALFDRPWDDRRKDGTVVCSEVDEEVLIYVPFTEVVKMRAICIIGGTAEEGDRDAPSKAKLFVNREDIDFDMAQSLPGEQQLDLQKGQYADIEHALAQSKFQSVRSVTLFISKNFGSDTTSLSFVHFRGASTKITTERVIVNTVYETTGQLKDHKERSDRVMPRQGY